ncbi:hypothetical protein E2C06_12240 [Dankookia rubra]|uniref:Uncharacterized protein n=1 Tax=Dankookia rubra TaxID=1442381 RepID=A0A4R5QI98_9PROT|nr:hypothetical protein [Dankookia rubra]TDH62371.1 hypothetical protein E2C06_12240 [Dankookia rubra]
MPDLSPNAVADWLRERDPDVATLHLLGPVDADPAVLRTMLRLGELLEQALATDAERLSVRLRHPATAVNLRAALAQSGMARRLRLLDWFGERGLPERNAVLALTMGAGPDGDFIRAELQALQRRALLARIYAPERLQMLLAACQPEGMTGGGA